MATRRASSPQWHRKRGLGRGRAATGGGTNRVNRGGSWNNNPRNARVANRNRNTPDNRNNNLGLRLVSTVRPATP